MHDLEPDSYKTYFRMNQETFDELHKLTEPFLQKKTLIGEGAFQ